MSYLIDSDWAIDHLADEPTAVALLDSLTADGLAISMVTYMEVFQGIARSPDESAATAKLQAFLAGVPVLPFTMEIAERCARLREGLKAQKKRVNSRALDLINAATALEHNLTFVTRNIDDYKDIPGLQLHECL